jgi:hypothetical protein
VTDWEAVARDLRYGIASTDDFGVAVERCTTERPSRIDTGVDVVIENDPADGTAEAYFMGNLATLITVGPSREMLAALGFPTEPMQVVEVKAEGEVQP